MLPKSCTVPECSATASRLKRTMCERHYYRQYRHGDVNTSSRIIGNDEARFWSYVSKSEECWQWTGAKNAQGYGNISIGRLPVGAHTFSLELATRSKRPDGFDTCHTCDNPSCVRPEHLYFGTRQQNIDDAWSRGRMPHGERKSQAKITELDVVAMRHEYAAGAEVSDLVEAYGLKDSTIRGIVLGFKWKRAGGPITRRRIYKKDMVA